MESMEIEVETEKSADIEPWADHTELSFISNRLRLNLKILSTLRQGRGRGKFGVVFYSILEDISECSRSTDPNFDVNDTCLTNKILPSIFDTISTLDELEFDEVQEALMLFIFHKWDERKCIRTLRIVSMIFGLIVQIAPSVLSQEYIQVFAKLEMPVQIQVFVLPAIIRSYPKPLPEIPESDPLMADYIKFLQIGLSENELIEEDINYLETFWSKMEIIWLPDLAQNLLPICIEMRNVIFKLNDSTITKVLHIIKLQLESQYHEVSAALLLDCAILLAGFSRFAFNEYAQDNWIEIGNLWIIISQLCVQTSPIELDKTTRLICLKCLNSFLSQVSVNSYTMLEDLHEKLSSVHLSPFDEEESVQDLDIPTGAYFVDILDEILDQMKAESVQFLGDDRKKLMNVLKAIVNYAK